MTFCGLSKHIGKKLTHTRLIIVQSHLFHLFSVVVGPYLFIFLPIYLPQRLMVSLGIAKVFAVGRRKVVTS